METNEILREQIFEIIKNQMKDNDPPETNKTFKRLLREKYSKFEAKQFIGQCLAVELFNLYKFGKPFDKKRYIKNLNNLPKEPVE
jgi:hypothetical protein